MIDTTFKMLIKCIHKENNIFEKVKEENNIKNKISKLLNSEGYKHIIIEKENLK